MLAEGLLARWKALEEQLPNVIRNLEAEEGPLLLKLRGRLKPMPLQIRLWPIINRRGILLRKLPGKS